MWQETGERQGETVLVKVQVVAVGWRGQGGLESREVGSWMVTAFCPRREISHFRGTLWVQGVFETFMWRCPVGGGFVGEWLQRERAVLSNFWEEGAERLLRLR